MIKVTGTGGPNAARGAQRTGGARKASTGSFRPDEAAGVHQGAPSACAHETASTSALGALIALQGDDRRRGARHQAMAERMLMLLERLRDGLVEGRIAVADLEALCNAASAKLDDPDEEIARLYAEIALRARVELAKLGR
ncbi:MAG: flagellar assembly protein FliX [Parvularculaceae bacterium]|nr:flagellar assembly protein FliX [Parvularculaceae bacterium]